MHNNEVKYLKENQIGASSKKVYGLKGDKVTVLTHSINMRLVQSLTNNHRFWVNVNNLSDVHVEKNLYEKEIRETKSAKGMAKKRR